METLSNRQLDFPSSKAFHSTQPTPEVSPDVLSQFLNRTKETSVMKCQSGYLEAYAYLACARTFQQRLQDESLQAIHQIEPVIINLALSIELFLKILLLEEGHAQSQVRKLKHDLLALYEKASSEAQAFLAQKTGYSDSALLHSIRQSRDAFQSWRYGYEQRGLPGETRTFANTVMSHLAQALCLLLEEKYGYTEPLPQLKTGEFVERQIIPNHLFRSIPGLARPVLTTPNSFIYQQITFPPAPPIPEADISQPKPKRSSHQKP